VQNFYRLKPARNDGKKTSFSSKFSDVRNRQIPELIKRNRHQHCRKRKSSKFKQVHDTIASTSDDSSNSRALKSDHFLVGQQSIIKPERDCLMLASNRESNSELRQKTKQEFLDQRHHDYRQQLRNLRPRFQQKVDIKTDSLVLVKDSNLPPLKWKIGRITKLYPGDDDVVRNVQVRTANGFIDRNVRYLCFLPSEESSEPAEDVPCGNI
jgi:hypothetical protein